MKKCILIFLIVFSFFVVKVKAADLTDYFDVENIKACTDDNCENICDDEIGCKATSKFLIKFKGTLHSPSIIQDGDTVILPFANEKFSEDISAYDYIGFSWSNIYDDSNNKIGKWKIEGNGAARKITIIFSDYAVGKTDVSGEFTTTKNISARYNFSDKIIPLTIGNKKKYIKFNTYSLSETRESSTFLNSSSSNNMLTLQAVSPRITIKQLYDTDNYPNFTDEAILNNLYFELPIPMSINASIDKLNFIALSYLPVSLTNTKASIGASNFDITSFFSEVTQNDNESYQDFKSRLNERQYGVYDDGDNQVLVVNYGSQPSASLSYSNVINNIDSSISEPGDYGYSINPFTINSSVRDIINNKLGSLNRIDGKVVSYGISVKLQFPTVKVETTKSFNGKWTWTNAKGEVKEEQKSIDAKMIIPTSIADVSGASQLILRDKDSNNEIVGARLKLQKKNGNDYEDIGEAVTDSSGYIMFNDLDSGTYRYVQTGYLNHYQNNSFKLYNEIGLENEIIEFEFDSSIGNILYATNERMKFTVTYLPGEHGDFTEQVYENIPYGDPTPYYEPIGKNNWIFKGWSPASEIYVLENKTYTAQFSKLVNVTTKYLEIGTGNEIASSAIDSKENGTPYTTEQKNIDNYDFVRVEGIPSGNRGNDDITVIYYYKKKEANLNIKYLDCSTRREIVDSTNHIVYYGDEYDSDIYEENILIPENYTRVATSKSDNYKGVVDANSINVEYCYTKKNSHLNASINITGTDRIIKNTDKASYKINYNTVFTDYIGEATIKIVSTLPYKIDVNDSDLQGGVYNDDDKTITWTINENVNSYNQDTYNIEKNIELKYKNINFKDNLMIIHAVGETEIENKNVSAEAPYVTYIDVKGNIIVKYLENETGKELEDSVSVTDKVGKKFEMSSKEIEGYNLVKKPEHEIVEFNDENQEFKFLYERIKFKILVTANAGGSITGNEEVFYKEDSTDNGINITANAGYYIKSIIINNKKISIPENQTKLTIPQFKDVTEDKNIEVIFETYNDNVTVPNTLKKSNWVIFGIGVALVGIATAIYIYYIRKK